MIRIKAPNLITIAKKKENNVTIFIDLDGVLSDWMDAACKLCDIDPNDEAIRKQLKKGKYLDELGVISDEEIWDKINAKGTSFWAELELFSWAKKLVQSMEKQGEMYFLTSPGECIPACSGKVEWVDKHFGKEYIKKTIICYPKEQCAGPNKILIDDSEKKIEKFRDSGGHAFLWPQQYKFDDGEENIDEIIDELTKQIHQLKTK